MSNAETSDTILLKKSDGISILLLSLNKKGESEYERLVEAGGGRSSDGKETSNEFFGNGACVVNAIVGIHEPGSGVCPYMLFAVKTESSKVQNYQIAKVPAATWAVFREDVPDHENCKIPKLFNRAYSEWLPTSGYDKSVGPDMEIYGYDFEEVYFFERRAKKFLLSIFARALCVKIYGFLL